VSTSSSRADAPVLVTPLTPPARRIDPRGMRFGAGASAIVLGLAFALDVPWLTALVGLNLLVSAALGTRYFVLGRPWPLAKRVLHLGSVEPEHEYPPRFAQAMGGTFLGLAAIAFLLGAAAVGWLLVAAVGALQVLLATTGICVGCRLYFLKWWVPSLFARLIGRGAAGLPYETPALNRS